MQLSKQNHLTCFIKKKKNNLFVSFYFLGKNEYYNLGYLTKQKSVEKSLTFLIEKIFSIIILKLKQYNLNYINLISNDKRFFKTNIIQLLFLNFTQYNIKLLKFTFSLNIPHNGCRQKKNVTLNKHYL